MSYQEQQSTAPIGPGTTTGIIARPDPDWQWGDAMKSPTWHAAASAAHPWIDRINGPLSEGRTLPCAARLSQ